MKYLLYLIFFIPIILHLHVHYTFPEVQQIWKGYNYEVDMFNWWKNAFLYAISASLLLFSFFKERAKSDLYYKICITIYFSFVFLSALNSNYFNVALFGMPNFLEGALAIMSYCVIFYFSSVYASEMKWLDWVMRITSFVVLISCALQCAGQNIFTLPVIRLLIFGSEVGNYGVSATKWPVYGTIMNSNVTGNFAALIFPFFLVKKDWLFVLISIAIAIGSQSRGAYVGMFCGLIYASAYSVDIRRKIYIPILGFLLCVPFVYHRYGNFHGMAAGDSGRVNIWKTTLNLIEPDDLWLGAGPAVIGLTYPQKETQENFALRKQYAPIIDRPHNYYIQTLYSSGIFALLSLLFIFGKFFIDAHKKLMVLPFSAAVLSYLVDVCFTDSSTSVAPLFWALLGIGVGLIYGTTRQQFRSRKLT